VGSDVGNPRPAELLALRYGLTGVVLATNMLGLCFTLYRNRQAAHSIRPKTECSLQRT
jgi:hypothetical protein